MPFQRALPGQAVPYEQVQALGAGADAEEVRLALQPQGVEAEIVVPQREWAGVVDDRERDRAGIKLVLDQVDQVEDVVALRIGIARTALIKLLGDLAFDHGAGVRVHDGYLIAGPEFLVFDGDACLALGRNLGDAQSVSIIEGAVFLLLAGESGGH